jgi:hypothetical protein
MLIVASPHVTWRAFGLEWLHNARGFARWAVVLAWRVRAALAALIAGASAASAR